MPVHDRSSFENLYAGQPRWEIGRPQKAILDVADRITGLVLDAGCGTGEKRRLHLPKLGFVGERWLPTTSSSSRYSAMIRSRPS